MRVETVPYLGLPRCRRLTAGSLELVLSADVGPRVLRFGFAGGENALGEWPDASVDTPLGRWRVWGGHRLWVAPESMPGSYAPDDAPVDCAEAGGELRLRAAAHPATGLQKELLVSLTPEGARIEHRIANRGAAPVELAAWALTILRGGGVALVPQEPYKSWDEELLPARPLALWHYSDLSDPRWRLGPRFIRLRTDAARDTPQKIGVGNLQGWAAYHRGSTLFVKRFGYEPGARYPDHGSNTELFTKGDFIEVESLGPLRTLAPGETLSHVERWGLFDGVSLPDDDAALASALAPYVKQLK